MKKSKNKELVLQGTEGKSGGGGEEEEEWVKKKKREGVQDGSESIPEREHKKKKRKKDSENSKQLVVGTEDQSPGGGGGSRAQGDSVSTSCAAVDGFLVKHSINIHSSNDSEKIIPFVSFEQLDIPDGLRSALAAFKEPTPIQACTWPPALQGRDLIGIAETGSGKTLAFGIPALVRLIASSPKKRKNAVVNVLVIAPTRELAIQTHDTLSSLGAPFGIASVAVFGGVPKDQQVKSLANAKMDGKTTRIVVGTPGRILDLVNDGVCDLSQVNYLVLDEADRMLDKGFENDIRSIISHTKQASERQTMMFSATWPDAVRRLAGTFLQNPIRITVGSDDLTANGRIEQVVEVLDDSRIKDSKLLAQLRGMSHKKTTKNGSTEARILVFVLYKKEASRVESMLRRQGYSVGALHGDMAQSARLEALDNFKVGTVGLLVATDVAARGLDIPNVGTVINYTFPLTIEDYIHRIGRTGRGGRSGKSITYFTGENHERSLAGELARVLRESGFSAEGLKKFPMTIKKREHSVYGAFYRDDIPVPKGPTKIVF